MLDLRWIVENESDLKEFLRKRRHPTEPVDTVIKYDKERRALIQEQESLQSRRNQLAKEIGQKKKNKEDADDLMAEAKEVNVKLESLTAEVDKVKDILIDHQLRIPNVLDPSVPEGNGEEDNIEISKHGSPRSFNFEVKDHVDIGEKLGIMDFERSAKLAGARFSTLIGAGARLNRAIKDFMLDVHTQFHGFKEFNGPVLVNSKALIGTSQLPKFAEDLFKIDGHDLFLSSTSEVQVTNFHREEILKDSDLPLRYTCHSPCFRSEAGSHGRDTRGMIRQHQFEKVELVILCQPEVSEQMHELIRKSAEEILNRLELPYRVVRICSGDIGFGGAKQYDLEVWLPSQNQYREISSCSNFFDYQARRANIRYRPGDAGKPQFLHTLNGSGLAIGRTLLAILENFQEEDGSVLIPKALQKYTGFDRIKPENPV